MLKKNSKSKPRVVSLFAGCGGLDLGFHEQGYEIVWANDFDEWAAKTYEPAAPVSEAQNAPAPKPFSYTPLIWNALAQKVEAKTGELKEGHPFLIWRRGRFDKRENNITEMANPIIGLPTLSSPQFMVRSYSVTEWWWHLFMNSYSWEVRSNTYCGGGYGFCITGPEFFDPHLTFSSLPDVAPVSASENVFQVAGNLFSEEFNLSSYTPLIWNALANNNSRTQKDNEEMNSLKVFSFVKWKSKKFNKY